ncbi:MAG: SPOR domain-containing protein [Hylemonella sp.]|uniref:SPOR domain-containing protein n=1 Tax=Hylemonella sp. TaxID=2066020 RepID=UPI00391D3F02
MKQQRGGTLLGLIIGVVIGLAVALIVALYVTKTPVPFLNKGQNRTPEQDAAEEKRNKDWDPNAPLYNKSKPPAQAETKPPVTATTKPATPAPAVKTPPKADAKPSADPLGDLAKAKAGVDPYVYFIQVGAFRTPEDAETQRAKLSLTGVEAKVSEREQAGRMLYRVRVGPYDKKDDANKVKAQLEAAGYETAMVSAPR